MLTFNDAGETGALKLWIGFITDWIFIFANLYLILDLQSLHMLVHGMLLETHCRHLHQSSADDWYHEWTSPQKIRRLIVANLRHHLHRH